MKRIYYIIAISLIILCNSSWGQQLPLYNQYMLNGFLINPAVAGHEGYSALNLTVREQWVGLDEAPSTYAFSAQTRLLKNSFISRSASIRRRRRVMSRSGRVGMGAYVFSDNNGAFNRTGFQYTYSYHLNLARSQLSFGASITGYQFKINDEKISLIEENDRLLLLTRRSSIIPDANFGIYFSNKNLYAGFSALQLFESVLRLTDRDGAKLEMVRHYYLMAGYRFDVVDFLFLEPSVLFKTTKRFVSQMDVNVKAYFKEDYWAGISFRSGGGFSFEEKSLNGRGGSFIISAGARVDKFYFGYAFDYTMAAISKRTYGSHELMIGAKFGDNARRYRWLNRY